MSSAATHPSLFPRFARNSKFPACILTVAYPTLPHLLEVVDNVVLAHWFREFIGDFTHFVQLTVLLIGHYIGVRAHEDLTEGPRHVRFQVDDATHPTGVDFHDEVVLI